MSRDDTKSETGALTRRELRERTGPAERTLTPAPPVVVTDAPAADAPGAAAGSDMVDASGAVEASIVTDAPAAVAGPPAAGDPEADGVASPDHRSLEADAPVPPPAEWADSERPATALTWVDPAVVAAETRPASLDSSDDEGGQSNVLAGARLRPGFLRAGMLVPIGTVATLAVAYSATMLSWPLHEVPPTIQAVEFVTTPPAAAAPTWPAQGSAAVGIEDISAVASSPDAASIASITKVVSSLMVLDRMPLQVGEQGPEFSFDYGDSVEYWDYRRANQSALDVPVGGVLTEYQLLQGTLIGSANNYIDRLAEEIWGSDEQFAAAAETWLAERGLSGITVVNPSGFDERNAATPEALLQLAELATANPVIASIIATPAVDLPGAGTVTNTNGMLADPGVIGVKTGTFTGWNLLTAKDVPVGNTTVRVYAAVLNQEDDDQRLAATRSLFAEVEAALQTLQPAVAAGTVVGEVQTPWGTSIDIVTDEDATVVLWNAATARSDVAFDLGDRREGGDDVGDVTVTGPVDAVQVDVTLAEDVEGPSPWWRLTHPLELLGLTDAEGAAAS